MSITSSLVRSGWLRIDSGKLGGAGYYGVSWSLSTSSDIGHAYALGFYTNSGINPTGDDDRNRAFPLRCLAS